MNKINTIMMTAGIVYLLSVVFACNTTRKSTSSVTKVPYTVVQNYFFINDEPLPTNPKITTLKEFGRMFGMATHMGKDGMPTQVDFKRQFVIAVVYPITNRNTALAPVSLSADGDTLTFIYHERVGKEMSSYMQPMLVIVVNKQYERAHVKLVKQ